MFIFMPFVSVPALPSPLFPLFPIVLALSMLHMGGCACHDTLHRV